MTEEKFFMIILKLETFFKDINNETYFSGLFI